MRHDCRDADTLVCRRAVFLAPSGVMKRHEIPAVVEDGGAGRAGFCVGPIPDHPFKDPDHTVVVKGDLLGATARMLDDVHPLVPGDRCRIAKQRDSLDVSGDGAPLTADDREIQIPMRKKEQLRLDCRDYRIGALVESEFRYAFRRHAGAWQNVVVCQQDPSGYQEASAE